MLKATVCHTVVPHCGNGPCQCCDGEHKAVPWPVCTTFLSRLSSLLQTILTLPRILLMARVQHMEQSLPSTKELMPLESQSHHLCVDDTKSKSLSVTPYHTPMLQCQKPKCTTCQFIVNSSGVAESYRLTQLWWVVASTVSRMKDAHASQISGWAGYNSLLVDKQATDWRVPLPEVAHGWSTLLTVVQQALQIKELAVGEDHITLITFDCTRRLFNWWMLGQIWKAKLCQDWASYT